MMLTLVMGLIVLKWNYRDELDQAVLEGKSESEHSAVQTLKGLKIGARFSNWSNFHRLAGQK